eukprot:8455664-Lingulodinium_polyedra.AAC.1
MRAGQERRAISWQQSHVAIGCCRVLLKPGNTRSAEVCKVARSTQFSAIAVGAAHGASIMPS